MLVSVTVLAWFYGMPLAVAGKLVSPETNVIDDRCALATKTRVREAEPELELRACTGGSQCGPGKPWPDRFPTPEDSPLPWAEIVGISYHFAPGGNQTKEAWFRHAAKHWEDHTCIRFQEKTGGSQVIVDTALNACQIAYYPDGWPSGYPGAGQTITVGLGSRTCNYGRMIHEIGHVVGMRHEQARPDASKRYNGHGPYLILRWDNIQAAKDSFSPKVVDDFLEMHEDSYVGSADDGPGDPYSGWAPYDFASIMHYSNYSEYLDGKGLFDYNFSEIGPPDVKIGQRSNLSPGDVLQILDIYQCKSRT